uniref:TNFR-Cys domain-containing protein n=1 Tax=Mola mola TaxID=94237 RepID=A0A3Q4BQS7_MOLML
EYQAGDQCCPMCPSGNRVKINCTEFRSTTCQPCTSGTFTDRPSGQKQCLCLLSVLPGFGLTVETECTETSDTVCEPLEGFYCVKSTKKGCAAAQKHTGCQPGQYISQHAGTESRDTVCSNCSEGTFSDGTLASCLPHRKCESTLITPGNASADAECGTKSFWEGPLISAAAAILLYSLVIVIVFLCFKKKMKTMGMISNLQSSSDVTHLPRTDSWVSSAKHCRGHEYPTSQSSGQTSPLQLFCREHSWST